MPTVVSATPAYTRAMDACGLNLYCENNEDWFKKLEKLITDSEARQLAGTTGFQHSENCYSEAIYLEKWDQLFQSVLQ